MVKTQMRLVSDPYRTCTMHINVHVQYMYGTCHVQEKLCETCMSDKQNTCALDAFACNIHLRTYFMIQTHT